MAICECLPEVSSICGSIGGSGSPCCPSGAASTSSDRPSRDHRTVPPVAEVSPPSTSRTVSPGTGAHAPVAASAVHTPTPSARSRQKAKRRPSGAQMGGPTCDPAGRSSRVSAPSAGRTTDRPVRRRIRRRAPSAASSLTPASAR